MLLLMSIVFALQATAVTPLSASTSNQHVENQHQALGEGLLVTTAESGSLHEAVRYWNISNEKFHCAPPDHESYPGSADDAECALHLTSTDHVPPNSFGESLEETFGAGIAANVHVTYLNESFEQERQDMVFQGDPSDNAIRTTTTLILFEDDQLLTSEGQNKGTLASNEGVFYAPNVYESDRVYNVVQVEVVVWRI